MRTSRATSSRPSPTVASLPSSDEAIDWAYRPMSLGWAVDEARSISNKFIHDRRRGEITIASLTINSTLSDTTVVTARRSGSRIRYRVVDEYEGDTLCSSRHRSSVRPLSLRELVEFFVRGWSLRAVLGLNFDLETDDPERIRRFVSIARSEFYPDFREAIESRIDEWLQAAGNEGARRPPDAISRYHVITFIIGSPGPEKLRQQVAAWADERRESEEEIWRAYLHDAIRSLFSKDPVSGRSKFDGLLSDVLGSPVAASMPLLSFGFTRGALWPTMMLAADEVWSTSGGGATPVMTRRHANDLASILGAALEAEWVQWFSKR